MTQRSILAGTTPTVVIKAGANVTVQGQDGDRVTAEASGRWGLNVERKKDTIEVQIGGSGQVFVPRAANLKIYAGKDIDAQWLDGTVDGYAGFRLNFQDVYCLGYATSGWTMNLDCQTMAGSKVEYRAGGDLRFCIHDLTSARIQVKDLGGYWEARIGGGEKSISLKSGGDVTLVTDQKVEALPPNYILGKIENPAAA
jgi:hypothetical protein